ncbi:MAG: ribonuclease III [Magnetococcus sp. DMHC-8]
MSLATSMATNRPAQWDGDTPEREDVFDRDDSLAVLQQHLGYRFTHREVLFRALTHRSYLQDGPHNPESCCPVDGQADAQADEPMPDRTGHNERLEFLGDAVLGLAISDLLFRRHPDQPEGALSHWRSALVNTRSLARIGHACHLGRFLHMGRGELLSGGRDKASLLGNTVEALLGAIYLDGGYPAAYGVIQHLFAGLLDERRPEQWAKDYKSMLQERLQGAGLGLPDYQLVTMEGAPHERVFQIACVVNRADGACGAISRVGFGRSKRMAEQSAAQAVFMAMYQQDNSGQELPWDGQEPVCAQTPLALTEKEPDHS